MSAIIGTVTSIAGNFSVKRANGSISELLKGDEVHEGDIVSGSKDDTQLNSLVVGMTDGVDTVMLGDDSQLFDLSLLNVEFADNETVTDIDSIEAMVDDSDFIENSENDIDDMDTEAGEEAISSSTDTKMVDFAEIDNSGVDINAALRDIDKSEKNDILDNDYESNRETNTLDSDDTNSEIADMVSNMSELIDSANLAAIAANDAARLVNNAANSADLDPTPENLEAAERAQTAANAASIDVSNAATLLEELIVDLNIAAVAAGQRVNTSDGERAVEDANAASVVASNAAIYSETTTDSEILDMLANVSDLTTEANLAAEKANTASQDVSNAVELANSNPTIENLNSAQDLQEEALQAANDSLNAADALENAVTELHAAATAAGETVDSTVLELASSAVENVDTSADNANQSANLNLSVSNVSDSDSSDNIINENVVDGTYTGVTLSATDVDGEAVTYSITDDVPFRVEADGRVVVDGDNAIDFEANENFTFDVTATSTDGTTSTQSVSVDVENINEAPVITDTHTVSMTEDSLEGFTGYGDTWSGDIYSIITQSEMLEYLDILDDSSTFSVSLANTDDGSSYHHGLQATDSTFSNPTSNRYDEQVIQTTQGFLNTYPQVDADVGDFYFDNVEFNKLGEGESANISFGVVVSDGEFTSEAKTINIEVQGSNDAPVITVTDTTVTEDIAQVIGNVSDIDGEIDSSTLRADNGDVIIAANGDIVYTPDADYNGTDIITISATDNSGATTTQTISVNIAGVEDEVTQVIDSDTTQNIVNENVADGTYTGVTLNAADVDGEAVTYSIADGVPFSVNADGQIVTSGEIDFETTPSYTFDVTATSTDGTSSTQSVTIDVANIEERLNANPVITVVDDMYEQINDIDIVSANFDEGFRFEADILLDEDSNTFFRQQDDGADSFLIEFGTEGFHNGLGNYIQVYVPTDSGVYRYEGDTPLTYDQLSHLEVQYKPNEGVTITLDGVEMGMSFTDGVAGVMNTVTDDNYVVGDTSKESFNGEVTNVSLTTLSDGNEVYSSANDISVTEGVAQIIATVSDTDGTIDANTLTAQNGAITMDTDGNIKYTPNEDYNGKDTVSISVTDNDGVTTTQTINLTVDAISDDPVVVAGETINMSDDEGEVAIAGDTNDTINMGESHEQEAYGGAGDDTINIDGEEFGSFGEAGDDIFTIDADDLNNAINNEEDSEDDTNAQNRHGRSDDEDDTNAQNRHGRSDDEDDTNAQSRHRRSDDEEDSDNESEQDNKDSIIDGGEGLDTLVVDGEMEINFGGLSEAISNVETIKLGEGEQEIESISTEDVLDMTDADNLLRIDGDAQDSIELNTKGNNAEWTLGDFKTDAETGATYQEVTGVEDDVTVTLEISTDIQIDQN